MSLDALFTEAAEAGGPPRFTEDDIALRVDARRARRRRIVAVGAALVVLGGGAFGLVAANRGGSESPADPIGPPEGGISAIAPTPQVLAGDWSSVPPGRGSFRFQVDGRVEFGNCNRFYGRWFEIGGDLVLGSAGGTEMGCGGADGELDRLLQTAPLTLYEDGLLRVGGHDQVIDFVRDDDATPPDPAAERQAATRAVVATADGVIGDWLLEETAALTLSPNGTATFEDCATGSARWSVEGGQLAFVDVEASDIDCDVPASGRPRLEQALRSEGLLTDHAELVFRGERGVTVLHRADVDPAPETPAVLAGTRWVTFGEELADRSSADWIEFDDAGRFRMSVVCGTHAGTYVATGSSAELTVTDRNLGAACDPIALPADAASAVIEGDQMRVDFLATAEHNLPEDLTTTYVDVDSLAVPTSEELVGAWSVGRFLPDSSFGNYQVVFDADGTARIGSCRSPVAWMATDDGIEVEASLDECLADYDFGEGTSDLGLRLDGERLYVDPETSGTITVLSRVDPEPRPTLVLHALRDDVGIEDWTDLPVADPEQEAAAEIGWDSGDTITVRLVAVEIAEPVDLSSADVVLDGRTAFVDGVLTFDCGGDRFALSGAERPPILDVGRWLLESLRCEAEPPA